MAVKRKREGTIVNGRVWEVIVKAGCSVNEAPTPIPVVPCTVQPTDELARICIRLKSVSLTGAPASVDALSTDLTSSHSILAGKPTEKLTCLSMRFRWKLERQSGSLQPVNQGEPVDAT